MTVIRLKQYPKYRNSIMVGVVAAACLGVLAVFPAPTLGRGVTLNAIFLLVIPWICIKIMMKESVSRFGVQRGEWPRGVVWMGMALGVAFGIEWLLAETADFTKHYATPVSISSNFLNFVRYELLVIGVYAVFLEFFFRGFVMLGLEKQLGKWAFVIQLFIFLLFVAATGNAGWNALPYALGAVGGGIVAMKTRSIGYSAGFNWLLLVLTDALAIGWRG